MSYWDKLPEHVINKIMLYDSHPCADMIKNNHNMLIQSHIYYDDDDDNDEINFSDLYFDNQERIYDRCFKTYGYKWLSKTRRRSVRSVGRYHYNKKHFTTDYIWYS
jgi:hypothetical protein